MLPLQIELLMMDPQDSGVSAMPRLARRRRVRGSCFKLAAAVYVRMGWRFFLLEMLLK
jgi:hypothetical protein